MSITQSATFCPAPWTSLNIDQTGRVSPCMYCWDSVGNIKQATIQEIIRGKTMSDIRAHMARGRAEVGYARDYMHAGSVGHKIAFEQIIKDYHGR